jgi:hypothetical protein
MVLNLMLHKWWLFLRYGAIFRDLDRLDVLGFIFRDLDRLDVLGFICVIIRDVI